MESGKRNNSINNIDSIKELFDIIIPKVNLADQSEQKRLKTAQSKEKDQDSIEKKEIAEYHLLINQPSTLICQKGSQNKGDNRYSKPQELKQEIQGNTSLPQTIRNLAKGTPQNGKKKSKGKKTLPAPAMVVKDSDEVKRVKALLESFNHFSAIKKAQEKSPIEQLKEIQLLIQKENMAHELVLYIAKKSILSASELLEGYLHQLETNQDKSAEELSELETAINEIDNEISKTSLATSKIFNDKLQNLFQSIKDNIPASTEGTIDNIKKDEEIIAVMHSQILNKVSKIPGENKKFHDAFNDYLENFTKLQSIGFTSIYSTKDELESFVKQFTATMDCVNKDVKNTNKSTTIIQTPDEFIKKSYDAIEKKNSQHLQNVKDKMLEFIQSNAPTNKREEYKTIQKDLLEVVRKYEDIIKHYHEDNTSIKHEILCDFFREMTDIRNYIDSLTPSDNKTIDSKMVKSFVDSIKALTEQHSTALPQESIDSPSVEPLPPKERHPNSTTIAHDSFTMPPF